MVEQVRSGFARGSESHIVELKPAACLKIMVCYDAPTCDPKAIERSIKLKSLRDCLFRSRPNRDSTVSDEGRESLELGVKWGEIVVGGGSHSYLPQTIVSPE